MKYNLLLAALACFALVQLSLAAEPGHNFARWEKEIAALELADKTNPPPQGGNLFVGASTIKRWTTLAQDFPDQKVVNRGFGGSQICDSTHFADRLIFPHRPKLVLLRSGGNDLNAGKTVEQVFADYEEFVKVVHGKLPEATIVFIAQNPSIARWQQADKEKALNDLVQKFIAGKPKLAYIETYDMVLGEGGKPREELFVADKLHFSPAGYKLLADRVRPHLVK